LERLPQEADHSNKLIGDLDALRYLDLATLEREGLGIYRHYVTGSNPYNSYGQPSQNF